MQNVLRATLWVAMDGISDDTKRALVLALQMDVEERGEAIEEMEAKLEAREGRVGDMPDLSSDKLLVFLAENVAGLQACPRESKSAYVRGLLDIYLLQRQKGAQLPATAPQEDAFRSPPWSGRRWHSLH